MFHLLTSLDLCLAERQISSREDSEWAARVAAALLRVARQLHVLLEQTISSAPSRHDEANLCLQRVLTCLLELLSRTSERPRPQAYSLPALVQFMAEQLVAASELRMDHQGGHELRTFLLALEAIRVCPPLPNVGSAAAMQVSTSHRCPQCDAHAPHRTSACCRPWRQRC
jgi:hypothetical protein